MIYLFLCLISFVLIINMALLGYIVRKIKEVDNDYPSKNKDNVNDKTL